MPSNLPAPINLGSIGACLMRAARLNADCSPSQGTNGGIVTVGLVTGTATPDVQEGARYEPTNACGATMYSVARRDKILRWNLSGEIIFFDPEMMELLFGGTLILGAPGGPFAGDVIGWASPNADQASDHFGAYVEFFTQAVVEGAGDCQVAGSETPSWFGNIFGKTRLVPGEWNFGDEAHRVAFTGTAERNPNLYDGPWNDFPGAGYIPDSPFVVVGYSQAQYEAIEEDAGAGYMDLPAAS